MAKQKNMAREYAVGTTGLITFLIGLGLWVAPNQVALVWAPWPIFLGGFLIGYDVGQHFRRWKISPPIFTWWKAK